MGRSKTRPAGGTEGKTGGDWDDSQSQGDCRHMWAVCPIGQWQISTLPGIPAQPV